MPRQVIRCIVGIIFLDFSRGMVMVEQAAHMPKETQSSFQVVEFSYVAVTDLENWRSHLGYTKYDSYYINLYEVTRKRVAQTCNASHGSIRQVLGRGCLLVLVAGLSTGQSAEQVWVWSDQCWASRGSEE